MQRVEHKMCINEWDVLLVVDDYHKCKNVELIKQNVDCKRLVWNSNSSFWSFNGVGMNIQ